MNIKKWVGILLSGLLVFAMFPVTMSAAEPTDQANTQTKQDSGKYATKDEVIYGKLAPNGTTKNMYVVNAFHITNPGKFMDYGNYSDVRNLTDLSDIEQKGDDTVEFEAEEDFYYQGELTSQSLPWDISITYLLDGQDVHPDKLAGQSGDLEIQIKINENKNIDPLFFDYYMLQISVSFDPLLFDDIQAPKGTEASEGKNKLVNFNVMPGEEEEIVVAARVKDFEMEPIDIQGVPANIGIDGPDTDELADEMQELADAIKDVNSGVADLNVGISGLQTGAAELRNGSNEYQIGITELNQSSGELVKGSEEILNALQDVSDSMAEAPDMPDLDDLDLLPAGLRDMATELREFSQTLDELKDAVNDIPDDAITDDQIEAVYKALEENEENEEDETNEGEANQDVVEIVEQLKVTYDAAQVVTEINKQIPEDLANLNKNMANHLDTIADGIETAMESLTDLDDLDELQAGLTSMSSEYESFHNGLITYTDGVSTLAGSYGELNSGTKELANGVSELKGGASTLHEGTTELEASTSDLANEMQSEIDQFMDEFDFSDFEPASFVSDKNKNIGVVQFVLQTESIEIDEPEESEEAEEETKGLWEQFLDLFR